MTVHGIRLLSIGLIVLSTVSAGGQDKLPKSTDGTTALPEVPAVIAIPAAPEPPKHPVDLPPKPPKVTCKGDELTILADNSTLDAILAAVKGCTGAKIDIPSGAGSLRSFDQFGPGPVRAVLDDLLSGTQYNYVIQSSATNPLKVETVMLSTRSTSDTPNTPPADLPSTPGRRAWAHMQKFDKPDPNNPDKPMDEASDSPASESVQAPADTTATTADANAAPAAAKTPDQATPAADTTAAAPAQPPVTPVAGPIVDPNSGGDPAKATEDRISAMQQMFNQRQQMMQKQNQAPATAPNN